MPGSLIAVAALLCLVVGLVIGIAPVFWKINGGIAKHAAIYAAAIMGAFLLNSWWLFFAGMAFYKLFILKEDT